MSDETQRRPAPFSVRLQDAKTPLEFGAMAAGESRSEFARRAIRERAERVLQEQRRVTGERNGSRGEAAQ